MAVSYKRLRYRLVDEKISMAKLMKISGITDCGTRKIGKNKGVPTEAAGKSCAALNREIQDNGGFPPGEAHAGDDGERRNYRGFGASWTVGRKEQRLSRP